MIKKLSKSLKIDSKVLNSQMVNTAIANNKNMVVLWQKLFNGRENICNLKNKQGELISDKYEFEETFQFLNKGTEKPFNLPQYLKQFLWFRKIILRVHSHKFKPKII